MCGICGIYHTARDREVDPGALKKMNQAIIHRGPDDDGYCLKDGVGLAMRRLSIIDVAAGQQPIYNEDRSAVIVYNGEVYNHVELRRELEAHGHVFRTRADTEAILHAYEEYGEECPAHLNGMFAFAIWDRRRRRLFIARDRMGVKPLYYHFDGRRLLFGSELKSILAVADVPREIDAEALDAFLTFEYIPAPKSIFRGIHKLPSAHWLSLEQDRLTVQRYWRLQYRATARSEEEQAEQLVELLRDAVKIRLMSEVPLGAFLSGGLDSSSIVAMMAQTSQHGVKTFSIGFDDTTYNELPYARRIAREFNTEHHEEIITPDALRLTEKIIHQLDEPFGDFSVFPTYMVSEMARKYVTVVLSGDGGDELLAGYDTYIADRTARRYQRLPAWLRRRGIEPLVASLPPTDKKKGLVNKSRRFIEGARLPAGLQHVRWMIFMQQAEKRRLYAPALRQALQGYNPYGFIEEKFAECDSPHALDQQEYVDLMTYLVDDILVKVDRMSMAVSLEARTPFLDYRFVEFCASLPPAARLRGSQTKYLLKRAMKGILPEEILQRRKEGFSIPIKHWIKEELDPLLREFLSPATVRQTGYFDEDYILQLLTEHRSGRENHSHRLWALLMFHMWHRQYMKG